MYVPGSIIGNRYQIIQKLGREEATSTYLAKDLQATGDGRCAIEQLSPNCDTESDWQVIKLHLQNKIEVLKRLGDHPQVPQFYDYFIEDQGFYLVREFIDGDSLEQEVERKVLGEADVIYLIQDVLRILDFLHKTNVIHRDVQPIHLVRRKRDNKFVLTHFSAIRELESTALNLQGELISNSFLGNWAYIAPEQKEKTSYFSSDIYALARTTVYALTGRSPQELEQIDLRWQSQCQISSKLETILGKMMAPSIEERYISALEVLQDLRPLLKIKQVVGGRYSITDYLGGDLGMETYVADNLRRQYQSPCLIKQIELLDADGDGKAEIEQRFAEELSILERLGYHQQIPQIWDHFVENDEFYLVQEFVLGENLAQKIERQDISVPQIISILESTLVVLDFIHENRIIHRNIEPSNLLIRQLDQQVVITDFGILDDIAALSNSNLGSSQDKQNYVSYEQIAGRPTISSDLYALGMTAIEALTKTKPGQFSRDSQTGKLLWQENLKFNRHLIKIIDRMIDLDLGQRYQSAQKVLIDLQRINLTARSKFETQESAHSIPRSVNRRQFSRFKSPTFPIITGLLGMAFLLGSIEFAFPTLRPIYYRYQATKVLSLNPQSALNIFTKAIDIQPRSWASWSGRGDALYNLERYSEALEAYSEATRLSTDNPNNWRKQGNSLYQLDKFTEAIASYDRALELEPSKNKAELYNRKGQALYELGNYEAALAMQKSALALDRFNAQFLSDSAKNLLAMGKYADALIVFAQVQGAEPSNPRLWQDKALALMALGRPQEVQKVNQEIILNYQKILREQPQNEELWKTQADFLVQTKMYRQAVNSYDQGIKIKPDFYQAWLGKGKALAELGETQGALDVLDKVLEIRPKSYLALQAKGLVYQNNQNNYAEAIANYDQATSINSNYAPLWRDRGLALSLQGNYTQAIKSLTKAVEINQADKKAWIGLATVWDLTGEYNKALSALDSAIKLQPQDPDVWSLKGNIYTKNGQYNEACETYRQSLLVNENSPSILSSMKILGCRLN